MLIVTHSHITEGDKLVSISDSFWKQFSKLPLCDNNRQVYTYNITDVVKVKYIYLQCSDANNRNLPTHGLSHVILLRYDTIQQKFLFCCRKRFIRFPQHWKLDSCTWLVCLEFLVHSNLVQHQSAALSGLTNHRLSAWSEKQQDIRNATRHPHDISTRLYVVSVWPVICSTHLTLFAHNLLQHRGKRELHMHNWCRNHPHFTNNQNVSVKLILCSKHNMLVLQYFTMCSRIISQ